MVYRVPAIVASVCLLSGCDSRLNIEQIVERGMVLNAGPAELPAPPGKIDSVQSTVFSRDASLGQPYIIRIVGNSVLVADFAKGFQLHVFDKHNGEITASVGRNGDGPGEFRGIWGIGSLNHRPGVFVYDYNVYRLTVVDADALAAGRLSVLRTLPLKARAGGIAQLPDGSWFSTNASTTSLYQHFDSTLTTFRDLPVRSFEIPARDSVFLKTAFEASVCGANGNRVAVVFRYASHVSIVDVNTLQEIEAKTPVAVAPNFIDHPLVGRRMFKNGNPGVRASYRDCAADQESIFALFSGRVSGKFDRNRVSYGKYIHEFDWAGNLRRVIQLDHDAISLTIDGTTLLTLSLDSASVPLIRKQTIGRSRVAANPGTN